MLRVRVLSILVLFCAACSFSPKREERTDRAVTDGAESQMVEIAPESKPIPKRPPVGFFEEKIETENADGKVEVHYEYEILVQLRCTQDFRIEAPLRGKRVKWWWDGVSDGVVISNTEGILRIPYRSGQPILSRNFRYEVHGIKGSLNLSVGPHLIVLNGTRCTDKRK